MATSTVKMTQRDYFNALRSMFANEAESLPDGMTAEMVVEFLDKRIAQLDKKAAYVSPGEKKLTARQKENDCYRDELIMMMRGGNVYSIDDMLKWFDEDMTHSRLAAILTKLVKQGVITRDKIKGKCYYTC